MAARATIVALLATAILSAAAQPCPDKCSCTTTQINCTASGLQRPPEGLWPNHWFLYLSHNNVSALHKYSLTGFPELRHIQIVESALTVLDVDAFTAPPSLNYLDLRNNRIGAILPPSPGKRLSYVRTLILDGNNISSVDPYVLETALPSLTYLSISNNPVAAECDYEELFWWAVYRGVTLFAGGCRFEQEPSCPSECTCTGADMICNARGLHLPPEGLWPGYDLLVLVVNSISALHEYSFTGFPDLRRIDIAANALTAFEWEAFAALPQLEYLNYAANAIAALSAPPDGVQLPKLLTLSLSATNISSLDVDVLESALPSLRTLHIDSTPLACTCNYEGLYLWAQARGVSLYTWCGNIVCPFETV